jgi:integrase
MAVRLSKRTADAAAADDRDVFVWDSELSGFGLKVTPAGRKVFVAQYRNRSDGRTRRVTIGVFGPLTVEEARLEARKVLGQAAIGEDPASGRKRASGDMEFVAVLEQFLREHVEAKRKARTAEEYRRIASLYLMPRWKNRAVTELSRKDVVNLHRDMAASPYAANRTVAILSKFFNWCEARGLRPDQSNPCRHVEKYPETKRERFLSTEEFGRLGQTLEDLEAAGSVAPWTTSAVWLLIYTGARLNEVLTLKWQHVDLERGLLLLPDSKTGRKTVYLNPPALAVLHKVPRIEGNSYVICGGKAGCHLVNLEKPWRAIRRQAGLEDVRLHDLRHTYASIAAGAGMSLPIIGKLLGHSQPQTTARYAHLAANPLQEANAQIGAEIARALKGERRDG